MITAARQLGEFLLIVIGLLIVMLGGGIDLSVGSNFALANIVGLIAMNVLGWPVWASLVCTIAATGLVGLINGVLVGYLRLRAFLTTLVTLIMVRAIVDILLLKYSVPISGATPDSDLWEYIGDGTMLGLPFSFVLAAAIAIVVHIFLSRSRPGWHVAAVGGSRRSAFNIGIPVRRTVCMTYVISGALSGVAGFLYAARLGGAGADTGVGLDIGTLTAAVLGGNSLGGGRGSVAKGILGAVIVLVITNGLVRLGFQSGATSMFLGAILLMAVSIDVRWFKNRHKVLSKVYVSPTYYQLPPRPSTLPDSGSPYALNDKLRNVEVIGLDQIEGPEDVILDRDNNLYCGSRHGDIVKFFGPDHKRSEIFAHIGGHPLGMAFDREGNIQVCVGGMGLYAVSPQGEVRKMTDERTARRARSSMMRASGSPTISMSRPMAESFSARRRSAMSPRTGPWMASNADPMAGSYATTRATAPRGPCCATSGWPMASAWPRTGNRCCSTKPGRAGFCAIGSTVPRPARSRW